MLKTPGPRPQDTNKICNGFVDICFLWILFSMCPLISLHVCLEGLSCRPGRAVMDVIDVHIIKFPLVRNVISVSRDAAADMSSCIPIHPRCIWAWVETSHVCLYRPIRLETRLLRLPSSNVLENPPSLQGIIIMTSYLPFTWGSPPLLSTSLPVSHSSFRSLVFCPIPATTYSPGPPSFSLVDEPTTRLSHHTFPPHQQVV